MLITFLLGNAVLGLWPAVSRLGAFAKRMVGCPAHSGDTNRPGNTRNGFGGLTLCPSLGESFRKPVPRVAVSLCACGATPQPVDRQGFSQTHPSRVGHPDNLRRPYFACWNGFRP